MALPGCCLSFSMDSMTLYLSISFCRLKALRSWSIFSLKSERARVRSSSRSSFCVACSRLYESMRSSRSTASSLSACLSRCRSILRRCSISFSRRTRSRFCSAARSFSRVWRRFLASMRCIFSKARLSSSFFISAWCRRFSTSARCTCSYCARLMALRSCRSWYICRWCLITSFCCSSAPWMRCCARWCSSSALTIISSWRASISALRRSSFSAISCRRRSTCFCCCSMIISVCFLCCSRKMRAWTSRSRASLRRCFSSSSSCSFRSCSFWYSSCASFRRIFSWRASSFILSISFCRWMSSQAFCRACASFCRCISFWRSSSSCRCCSSATCVSFSSYVTICSSSCCLFALMLSICRCSLSAAVLFRSSSPIVVLLGLMVDLFHGSFASGSHPVATRSDLSSRTRESLSRRFFS
mmetsp:Transcript_61649/g.151735  ORF Transcript_61649/g.151735 Transcript_61649/m.151735 type:complete len:414 (-) Transcript_61649:232-1473(-)